MLSIKNLGTKIREKRGNTGIRVAAEEIGVSPATLSRIENGHVPDLETFGKLCRWLNIDPAEVLGLKTESASPTTERVAVHFKKEPTLKPETAKALANLVMSAQRAMELKRN